jgi:hypothetical protein
VSVPLQRLVELSRLDVQLAALEEDLTGLPARRSAALAQQSAAEERSEAAREELARAEQEQRKSEVAAQDQEALLRKLQGQQFQVKSNDAYTALLSEMERAQAAISEAETKILEAMEAIEAARARHAEVEDERRRVVAHVEGEERASRTSCGASPDPTAALDGGGARRASAHGSPFFRIAEQEAGSGEHRRRAKAGPREGRPTRSEAQPSGDPRDSSSEIQGQPTAARPASTAPPLCCVRPRRGPANAVSRSPGEGLFPRGSIWN